ncbi:GDSL esterase/lipase At3g26430-like isoform X1 [Arachis stenosperma]|uniref:GDSL esterase/lipase At3g26430-like isoform X1 n=1 Tax=Arachis stenosperma TaxID=217475 RepID=UPI0025AB8337|nr:GDSL esterase/lipase At3g26430-like isoform X1 [Arachis stenosperma]
MKSTQPCVRIIAFFTFEIGAHRFDMDPVGEKKWRHILSWIAISMTLVVAVVDGRECSFPAIFNLGDSNSDTGGLTAAFGPAPPPNGITFFHSPAGRFSDGRLIIDFIAQSFDLPYLSAYLDSVGSNFTHGVNFATAGSTVRRQNTTLFQSGYSPISLDVQSVQLSEFKARSKLARKRGDLQTLKWELLPKEEYFSEALYTFDIGQNDITAGYKLNMTSEQVKAYVPDVLTQFSNVIRNVYEEGGRSFWIHNTGPLGCLPYMLDRYPMSSDQIDKSGCAKPFNQVAQYFNRKLKDTVMQLRKQLPEAAITYVDVYRVKYSLISNAQKYGFEDRVIACCGEGGKYNYNNAARCGATKVENGKKVLIAKSCKDPSVRIIWDGIHYTEAANYWIFQQIANGSFSDPPLPLNMACEF